jgi:hypothetical protein
VRTPLISETPKSGAGHFSNEAKIRRKSGFASRSVKALKSEVLESKEFE